MIHTKKFIYIRLIICTSVFCALFTCTVYGQYLPYKAAYILVDDNDIGYRTYTDSLMPALQARGYRVKRINFNWVNEVREDIKRNRYVMLRVVIFVNGHGSSDTSKGIAGSKMEWEVHSAGIGINSNIDTVTAKQLVDIAKYIQSLGLAVVVIDHSCGSGSTTRLFEWEFPNTDSVCAISTTGTVTASGVGAPSFYNAIHDSNINNFEQLGLWGAKQLIPLMRTNNRVHQLCYMNDCSRSMMLREGLNVAASNLTTWPTWNRLRYYHVYMNPERYYLKKQTNPLDAEYGPRPNQDLALRDFQRISVRDIEHLKGANVVFAWGLEPPITSSALFSKVMKVHDMVKNLDQDLNTWKNAVNEADNAAKKHRVCGLNLSEAMISAFWARPRSANYVLTSAPPCSIEDKARIKRYYRLANGNNPKEVVSEILKDYPEVGAPIQRLRDVEKATFEKIVAISDELYANVEQEICNAKGCRNIRIND